MKVHELIPYLHDSNQENRVSIEIKLPYASMGGTPTTNIDKVYIGFDWDDGQTILIPSEELMRKSDINDIAEVKGRMHKALTKMLLLSMDMNSNGHNVYQSRVKQIMDLLRSDDIDL